MKKSTIAQCRQALRLNVIDGKTLKDAAEEIGVSINSIKKYRDTEAGQQFENELDELSKQLFREQLRADYRKYRLEEHGY